MTPPRVDAAHGPMPDHAGPWGLKPRSYSIGSYPAGVVPKTMQRLTNPMRHGVSVPDFSFVVVRQADELQEAAQLALDLARDELLVPSDLAGARLRAQLIDVLKKTKSEWRTPRSLARQLDVDESDVRDALEALGNHVRRPIAARGVERDYFRLTERGTTRREKLRRLKLALGRTPVPRHRVAG